MKADTRDPYPESYPSVEIVGLSAPLTNRVGTEFDSEKTRTPASSSRTSVDVRRGAGTPWRARARIHAGGSNPLDAQ